MKSENPYGPLGLIPGVLHHSEIDFGDRVRTDYEDDGELEASILEKGILQSILVLQRNGERPLLLAGGRRFKVAEKHNLDVPVLISTKELSRLEMKTIELVENLHRKKLSYDEELSLTQQIHELQIAIHGSRMAGSTSTEGWTMKDTAKMLGVDQATISKDLQLAKAIEILPELKNLKNKTEAARQLAKIIDQADREDRAEKVKASMGNSAKIHLCNSYVVKDFFEGVKQIPDETIDFVEVDPFYGIELIDLYEKRRGGNLTQYNRSEYEDCPREVYEWYITETMRQCYRTMVDGSWGICWFAMEPWFEPTFQAIRTAGFFSRRVPGIWVQPTGAAYNANLLLASAFDTFFYFRKGQVNLASPGHLNTYHCNVVPPSRKIHPTERPVELYEEIFRTFAKPGAKVLVPFAGSGNSLLACANLSMLPLGFDLSQEHKTGYILKVNNSDPGHYKSLASQPV